MRRSILLQSRGQILPTRLLRILALREIERRIARSNQHANSILEESLTASKCASIVGNASRLGG